MNNQAFDKTFWKSFRRMTSKTNLTITTFLEGGFSWLNKYMNKKRRAAKPVFFY